MDIKCFSPPKHISINHGKKQDRLDDQQLNGQMLGHVPRGDQFKSNAFTVSAFFETFCLEIKGCASWRAQQAD